MFKSSEDIKFETQAAKFIKLIYTCYGYENNMLGTKFFREIMYKIGPKVVGKIKNVQYLYMYN